MALRIVKEAEPIKVERIKLCTYGGLGRSPPSAPGDMDRAAFCAVHTGRGLVGHSAGRRVESFGLSTDNDCCSDLRE